MKFSLIGLANDDNMIPCYRKRVVRIEEKKKDAIKKNLLPLSKEIISLVIRFRFRFLHVFDG